MALIPFMLYDLDDFCRSLTDRNIGLEVRQPKRMSLATTVNGNMSRRNRDLDQLRDILDLVSRHYESTSRTPPVNRDDFQVVLDVQHFKPEEIEVKIVDNYLVVAAKHEDREDDHGWISRQFVRRYELPKDVNVEGLTSRLSSDGLLTIVAPKVQPLKDETERTLQIECTGKPFLNKKQEKPKTTQNEEEMKPE